MPCRAQRPPRFPPPARSPSRAASRASRRALHEWPRCLGPPPARCRDRSAPGSGTESRTRDPRRRSRSQARAPWRDGCRSDRHRPRWRPRSASRPQVVCGEDVQAVDAPRFANAELRRQRHEPALFASRDMRLQVRGGRESLAPALHLGRARARTDRWRRRSTRLMLNQPSLCRQSGCDAAPRARARPAPCRAAPAPGLAGGSASNRAKSIGPKRNIIVAGCSASPVAQRQECAPARARTSRSPDVSITAFSAALPPDRPWSRHAPATHARPSLGRQGSSMEQHSRPAAPATISSSTSLSASGRTRPGPSGARWTWRSVCSRTEAPRAMRRCTTSAIPPTTWRPVAVSQLINWATAPAVALPPRKPSARPAACRRRRARPRSPPPRPPFRHRRPAPPRSYRHFLAGGRMVGAGPGSAKYQDGGGA